jgi:hypothetical protein
MKTAVTVTIRALARPAGNSKDEPKQKLAKVTPKKPKKDLGGSGIGNESDRITDILIRAIDAKPRLEMPPPSVEEMKRRHNIANKYVVGMFQRENAINHDLACKLRLKNHAIRMLPKNNSHLAYLRHEALKVSMDPEFMPPTSRPIPVDTPPIPNFKPSQFISKDKEEDDDELDDERSSLKKESKKSKKP